MRVRLSDVMEWLAPSRVHRPTIPPMEGRLTPNDRLDRSVALGSTFDVDDIVSLDGSVIATDGTALRRWDGGTWERVIALPGRAKALAVDGGRRGLLVAVQGTGICAVTLDGSVVVVCADPVVRQCVTALSVMPDGALLACVGSTSGLSWSRALVSGVSDGALARIAGDSVEMIADGLAWPAGAAPFTDGGYLVSLSHDHAIVVLGAGGGRARRELIANLPGYPGRICATGADWWAAVPYPRSRAFELLLDEDDVLNEMVSDLPERAWLIPRLTVEKDIHAPLQLGQAREMGEIKPWAPPRSYGLLLRFDAEGRVVESAHSRTSGRIHGITAVCELEGTVVVGSAGARTVVTVERQS
ncbi:hypothetical protein [Georgenia sp. SYP-B2076]|uniref:hypothetical protein n=1 Tax=Georgenia sp. SYP-B2076 TaxID=2495881 RepID=UPI000F8C6A69|nr:hypothetical protein [Georgenia sp. SYP-B2076]